MKAPRGVVAPGQTRLLILKFRSNAVMASAAFDPAAAGRVCAAVGRAVRSRASRHAGDGLDRLRHVLDGEIWLELDDSAMSRMLAGDIAIQFGTHHAWRNRSDRPTTMAFLLIDACRA